ncbi:PLAC8 family-domain-containing protein [Xylariaceae sp. FL0594]|nr:PLAC8 family-domain-containing protein [Xylariaceae sp. FL0594]
MSTTEKQYGDAPEYYPQQQQIHQQQPQPQQPFHHDQTSERIRDPTGETADMMNSDCLIHGAITCFTGCGWIYAMIKRGEIRERYNIKGSGCGDCCVSFWCSCCALIQQDNEVKRRQEKAGPITQGYQPQPGMHMPEPQPAYHQS